ncbi:LRPPRC (predicted), partial [Pycnogonum litorale]
MVNMASLLRPIRSSCRLYSLQRYLNTRCSIVGKNKYVVFKGTKNDEFSKREFSTGNELSVSANIARNVSDDSLDRALHRADMDVRRTGRLNRSHVDYIFSEIQKLGTTSPTKSLLLIRCCGSLIAEEVPEKRNQLVNDIWKTLIKQNSPIDVSHYNALIKVYLENNHKFSCTEFLQEMKENGIEPNRVTYQRMIEKYCQEGDIEGASNILQLMKDSDMAVNESVFNALIVGHSRANDMENAKKVLEVMNNANLEPSSTTYTSLLCAYAEQGDIQSIRETLT